MPSRLTNLLLNVHPYYDRQFLVFFNSLPIELSLLFHNRLNFVLDSVYATLPTVLTPLPPENPSYYYYCVQKFTSLLTILLGIVFTTVTLFVPSEELGDKCSNLLTAMYVTLYTNPCLEHLPDLLNTLETSFTSFSTGLPYHMLTNFPCQLSHLLINTPFSQLYPLCTVLDGHLNDLVFNIYMDLAAIHEELNQQLNCQMT